MERFQNADQYCKWVRDARGVFTPIRGGLEREYAVNISYYEGVQWATAWGLTGFEALKADLNPDSARFRPTLNRTTLWTNKSAVATSPSRIEAEVAPTARDMGIESEARAQTLEDFTNLLIGQCGLHDKWDEANHGRSVTGNFVVGLCIRPTTTVVEGKPYPDCQIRTFADMALNLTLDPHCTSTNLHEHPFVIWSKVWTLQKIRSLLGPMMKDKGKLDLEDEASFRTVGELAPFEKNIHALTSGRLFGQYQSYSETKGAIVHQVHRQDETGRYPTCDIFIERGSGELLWVNEGANASPFGGAGLPFTMLRGDRRVGIPFSIGDTARLKDDQDRLNRTNAADERQMQVSSKHKWLVDTNAFDEKDPRQIANRFTNLVGGIIPYNGGTKERPNSAPQLITVPPPQQYFLERAQHYEEAMRLQVHRAAGHQGEVKTHTTAGAFSRALDEADAPLDKRVSDDVESLQYFLGVLAGTGVRLVQRESPAMLALLRREDYTPEDLATLSDLDASYPACEIIVRSSVIRRRSATARKSDLDTAYQLGAFSDPAYRRALASAGMDTPLTDEDRFYEQRFTQIARRVLRGEEWQPKPLGSRTNDLIENFRRAMLDRRADPAAQDRLSRAIQGQMLLAAQEAAILQQAQPGAQPAQPGVEGDVEADFSKLVSSLEAGSQVPA